MHKQKATKSWSRTENIIHPEATNMGCLIDRKLNSFTPRAGGAERLNVKL